MLLKWHHMTMVRMNTHGTRFKFIDELPAGAYRLKDSVHLRRMYPMKMHGMRAGAVIDKINSDDITFSSSDSGTGNRSVKRPDVVKHPGGYLHYLMVLCNDGILSKSGAVRQL